MKENIEKTIFDMKNRNKIISFRFGKKYTFEIRLSNR